MWETNASLSEALLPKATPRRQPRHLRPMRVAAVVLAGVAALFGACVLLRLQRGHLGLEITTFQSPETERSVKVLSSSQHKILEHGVDEEDDDEDDDHDTLDEHEELHDSTKPSGRQLTSAAANWSGILGDAVTQSELLKLTSPQPLPEQPTRSREPSHLFGRVAKRKRKTTKRTHRVRRHRKRAEKRSEPQPTASVLPAVSLFPANAAIHNASFITRSNQFDNSVSHDKGILISIHNRNLAMGLSLIKELRCLGNHELIQVYHCLPQDLSETNKQLLVSQDNRLEVIDVCSDLINANVFTEKQAKQFKNAWLKPLAIHHTDLKEPLLLDAAEILFTNPADIRDSEGYNQAGTLFFYDRVVLNDQFLNARLEDPAHTPVLHAIVDKMNYSAFGLAGSKPSQHLLTSLSYQGKSASEMESSMVAIDKSRPGKAMDVLWWVITKLRHVKPQFSVREMESLWLSFELAQQPYAFTPWGVSVVGSYPTQDLENQPEALCGSLAQYVPSASSEPQLLSIHGKAMLDPHSQSIHSHYARPTMDDVKYVVPRMPRTASTAVETSKKSAAQCLVGMDSTPLPATFQKLLSRRRTHYNAIVSGQLDPLDTCAFASP